MDNQFIMNKFLKYISILLPVIAAITGVSQELNPVNWSFAVEQKGEEAKLLMTAQIEEGWHIYSQFQDYEDGPLPTEFSFNEDKSFDYNLDVKEPENIITKYDPDFELNLSYFEGEAVFTQDITVSSKEDFKITGTLMFMTCNGVMCLPPEYVDVIFEVEGN